MIKGIHHRVRLSAAAANELRGTYDKPQYLYAETEKNGK
jgi:hypothetical protein